MIWAKFDIEILDEWTDLYDTDPGHPWRFMRLVQIAKRANWAGKVIRIDGSALDARALARLHDPRLPDGQEVWGSFLQQCLDLGLLSYNDGCWQIVQWRRWHSSPSDSKEARRERVARCRARKKDQNVTEDPVTSVTVSRQPPLHALHGNTVSRDRNDPPQEDSIKIEPKRQPCNGTVTESNGCNDTEQSRAEHDQSIKEIDRSYVDLHASEPRRSAKSDGSERTNSHRSEVFEVAKGVLRTLEPSVRWTEKKRLAVEAFIERNHLMPLTHGQVLPEDLCAALRFGCGAALWKRSQPAESGTDKLTDAFAYALSAAQRELAEAVSWRSARAFGLSKGYDCGEFVFRPPRSRDPTARAAGGDR